MQEHVAAPAARAYAPVSRPGDRAETEADRVADELADRPAAEMAGRLGFDFGRVRIHHDVAAAESARALGARAYTANGRDIVFGAGEYSPTTRAGRHLLAHELAHVAQRAPYADVIHRQPAPMTLAQNFAAAVQLLSTRQPLLIFQALSAVTVGGPKVQVHQVQHVVAGKPVTSVFNLQLSVRQLGTFKAAEFQAPSQPVDTPGTRTYNMEIHVGTNTATYPPVSLARDLFHEGMHMQLYIDRASPSWDRSNYLRGLQSYLDVAHKSALYAPVLADMTAFIARNVRGKPATTAASDARTIIDAIMEEKYAVNSESQIGPAQRATPVAPDRGVERSRVNRWLSTYLQQVGVTNFPVDEVGSMGARLAGIWVEIDMKAPPIPRYPVPMGLGSDAPVDPLPEPTPVPP